MEVWNPECLVVFLQNQSDCGMLAMLFQSAMARISKSKTDERSQAILDFLRYNGSATYKELADFLGVSKPALYRWMNSNPVKPWYYCKTSRRIQYPECCRHLDSIFDSNIAPDSIDEFLDWLKSFNCSDGQDLILEISAWCMLKPRSPLSNLLRAVVDRIRERMQYEAFLPAMWQDPLMVATEYLSRPQLKEMRSWLGEGDDWDVVRAKVLGELGFSTEEIDRRIVGSIPSERQLFLVERGDVKGRVVVTEEGDVATLIELACDVEDVSPNDVDGAGKEMDAWVEKNMLPRCDVNNLPYDPFLLRSVIKEVREGNCRGLVVAECDTRKEVGRLIHIVGAIDEKWPVSQEDRAKVESRMGGLAKDDFMQLSSDGPQRE